MMQAPGAHTFGELDGVPRAIDVRELLGFGARRDVVDRREVEHVLDFVFELRDVCR